MRIAITGASGFIGTDLLNELNKDNSLNLIGLTRSLPEETEGNLCEWRQTDYSYENLKSVLKDVDTVIHLAAVRGTTINREDYVINEEITENILKSIVYCGIKRIVFASTISVYDNVDTIPWKEDYPLEPRTMYGASKIACEELIKSYSCHADFDYSIIRIAQVLGMGEKRRGMMNVFLDTAATGGAITVIGKSMARRQYIYVGDLVAIIRKLAMLDEGCSTTVNVGMSHAYSNLEIAQIVNGVYGNATPINYDDSKPETIKSSCMSIERLRETLKYVPLDMKDAVEKLR